jgi:short-subunit dehydrogenase
MTTALVTGASAGIGRELARLLAKDGASLVLVARRRDRLEELAVELRSTGAPSVLVVAEDLGDAGAPARIEAAVKEAGLELEVLVNNAGFGSNGAFSNLDGARELEMVQVNISAVIDLTRRFLPTMLKRGRGRILNVGSTAGFQPGPFMATYYATKAFVNSFTEGLAFELRGTGVTATVSCPGPVATEFAEVAGSASSRLFEMSVAQPETVAREAYDAMNAGKSRVVHGFMNAFGAQVQRLSPRGVIVAVAARLNRAKGGSA